MSPISLAVLVACKSGAAPPAAAAPDAGGVDWARAAAAVYLVGEDYRESREVDGGLDERRPLMDRMLAEFAPHDAEIAALRERLKIPVDYDLPKIAKDTAGRIEQRSHLPLTPPQKPDLAHGKQVFASACAPCHGKAANGVPEIPSEMDPPPSDLLHAEQAWRPYDMFARVTWGGLETAMPAFGDALSVQDRWDLTFWLFAERWPPCARKDAPVLSAADLALSSDYDLSYKVPYDAIACVRRNFTPPPPPAAR